MMGVRRPRREAAAVCAWGFSLLRAQIMSDYRREGDLTRR